MRRHIVPDMVDHQNMVSASTTASVSHASELMLEHGVKSVLVTEENHLTGILTVSDVVCRVVAKGMNPGETAVGEVMTENPTTVEAAETPIRALRLMRDGGFWHIPVIDDGKVVGILSRSDFEGAEMEASDRETDLWEHIR